MKRVISTRSALTIVCVFQWCLSTLVAQDIHFTQYYLSPQLINPAACAAISSFEAGLQYKSQWQSLTKGYTTYAAFASAQIKTKRSRNKNYLGLGLNAYYDQAGDGSLQTLNIGIPVNYQLRINRKNFLSAGISLGFIQRSIVMDRFSWGNQFNGYAYNGSLPSYETNTTNTSMVLDLGAGLAWIYRSERKTVMEKDNNRNVLGLSATHLNRPSYSPLTQGADRLNIRYNLYEYCHLNFEHSDLSIIPSALIQLQGKQYEYMIGNYFRYVLKKESQITGYNMSNAIGFGVYYRSNDAMAFNCILEYQKYSIGIAYDLNLSPLIRASKGLGGLELCLKFNGGFDYLYKGFSKF